MLQSENADIYPNKGIWTSYIYIDKRSIPKEFDDLVPKLVKWGKRESRGYYDIDHLFEMSGGLTFFESARTESGKMRGFRVGNDYNHIWNGEENLDGILHDVKKSIDHFIDQFPRYKVWSVVDGGWVMPKNLDAHNKKARRRMKRATQ